MENKQNQNAPKLFTVNDLTIATFLGGIFAGGYMFYKNFKILGQHENAKKTIWISILMLVALIALSSLVDQILVAIGLAVLGYFLFKKYQKKESIEYRANTNNNTAHWTKTLGVIVLTVIAQIALIFISTILIGMILMASGVEIPA